MSTTFNVRPPWPDERARLQHFLPTAFLFGEQPFLLVAVRGRVERFVGALSMSLLPLEKIKASWLLLRVEDESSGEQLLARGLEAAWAVGAQRVYLGQTLEEDSEAAKTLLAGGFEIETRHEVYEVEALPFWERVSRIHDRLRAGHLVPEGVEITTLQPSVVPKVRKFLAENLPRSASALALETAGYKPEHSLALFLNGEVKGALLSRRLGPVSYTGLRVVATELRGTIGWANLLLLYASLRTGLQTGLEIARFEFNPQLHQDTKQFAEKSGGTLVGRRLLFKLDRCSKKD